MKMLTKKQMAAEMDIMEDLLIDEVEFMEDMAGDLCEVPWFNKQPEATFDGTCLEF